MAGSRAMNSHSPFNASSGISCSSSPAYLWGDTGGYLSDMKIHPRRVPFLAGMVDHEPPLLSVPATSYIGYLGGSSGNLTVLLGEAQSRHKKAKVKRVLGSSNNLTTFNQSWCKFHHPVTFRVSDFSLLSQHQFSQGEGLQSDVDDVAVFKGR